MGNHRHLLLYIIPSSEQGLHLVLTSHISVPLKVGLEPILLTLTIAQQHHLALYMILIVDLGLVTQSVLSQSKGKD